MKIHTDTLEERDLWAACRAAGMAGVSMEKCDRKGSRSKDHAFNVSLRGNSTRRPNPGTGGRYYDDGEFAATWDEWGMFIHALYVIDPDAMIGQYGNRTVFEDATAMRFETLTAQTACPGHHWKYAGPMIQACTKCDATNNYGAIYARGAAVGV